ncbi:hypothetical protein AB0K51_01900 [Kitasatospora sp. NPDC049285]|uniref:hypothetical protein n=1 Tax=Kitasatospora sp. NPDC049285 TaxID=3157096 RepID=UPI0034252F16
MSTEIYTRRLVEHRYGRTVAELQLSATRRAPSDPVLPIVLRRLTALAVTEEQERDARRRLDLVGQCPAGDGELLLLYATEALDLDRQKQAEAEAIWDLLDIRLLLDQPSARSSTATPPSHAVLDIEHLMPAAREIAAGLRHLTRDSLREGLRTLGIQVSNKRLGVVLRRLREERTAPDGVVRHCL